MTLQATIISYMNDFKLMMIMSLAVMPLLLLLKKAPSAKPDPHVVME